MTWFTIPTVLLLLSLCVLSTEENGTLVVYYRQRTVTLARGSSVKLSCQARYDFKQCSLVHVVWRHTTEKNFELTDSSKYLTTVNETCSDGNVRLRQVDTEILNLTAEDDGQFQCNAECESGEKAIGHIIQINVTD
ncbi:hypothetical protein PAMP_002586 [Pampus punctatissimus]